MIKFWEGEYITELKSNEIFVFGSNPEGRHASGTAKVAKGFGAVYGNGRGIQGRCYALPTKNLTKDYTEFLDNGTSIAYPRYGLRSITKEQIKYNIKEFYDFAKNHTDLKFLVAYRTDDNNLNGYSSKEMIEMFTSHEIPDNVYFYKGFKNLI